MHLEIINNNNTKYIRVARSKRVFDEATNKYKVKKETINIGPVSRFDDGKPDFIERLKASFTAGTPIIKELEQYAKKKEIYNITLTSDYIFENPKIFSNIFFDKLLDEIGLTNCINMYKTYDNISYDVFGYLKLLVYVNLLNLSPKTDLDSQNDIFYNGIIDGKICKDNIYNTLDFIYKHKSTIFNIIDKTLREKSIRTSDTVYYDLNKFYSFDYDNVEESALTIKMGLLINEHGIPISIEKYKNGKFDFQTLEDSLNSIKYNSNYISISKAKEIIRSNKDSYFNFNEIKKVFNSMNSIINNNEINIVTNKHLIAYLSINVIALILLRLIQKKIKDNLQINFTIKRIQEALNIWKIERLTEEYFRYVNINNSDLIVIFNSFNINIPKKLYKLFDIDNIINNIIF